MLDTSARYSRMRMYVECRCIQHVMYLPQSAWSRMECHTVPRTASNTLNRTGMPGEVRPIVSHITPVMSRGVLLEVTEKGASS